jgi:thiol:disulfide interchange protein DsbD
VLVVSPCVTAPLVGVLTFIAQSGDVLLGSFALFALGLGMGLPLLVIGTTEGKLLPKAGHWMNAVKAFFGILLVIVSINLLQRILTASQGLMVWAVFFMISAVYLGVGVTLGASVGRIKKLSKAIGFILFFYGIILLFGAAMGNGELLNPLRLNPYSSKLNIAQNTDSALSFQSVKTLADVQKQLAMSKSQNQIVMLDFYANWCVACHEMEKNIFSDKKVNGLLNGFTLLRADVTNDDSIDNALKKYFNVIAPPTILFFDKNSNEMAEFRIVGGSLSVEDFSKQLEAVKTRQSP